MSVTTASGVTISLTAAQPASYDEAGYDTLFTTAPIPSKIGELIGGPELKRMYQLISYNLMDRKSTEKHKGSFDDGSFTLNLVYDYEDDGQLIAQEALDSANAYSAMISLPNGVRAFFQMKVFGFGFGAPDANQMVGATMDVQIVTTKAGVGVVISEPA